MRTMSAVYHVDRILLFNSYTNYKHAPKQTWTKLFPIGVITHVELSRLALKKDQPLPQHQTNIPFNIDIALLAKQK